MKTKQRTKYWQCCCSLCQEYHDPVIYTFHCRTWWFMLCGQWKKSNCVGRPENLIPATRRQVRVAERLVKP